MAAYLLTWNPNKWPWRDLHKCVKEVEVAGLTARRWSVGNTQRINPDDRCYLMQLGAPSRGIVGAGYFTSKPYSDKHWNGVRGKKALYSDIELNQLCHPENGYLIPHGFLKSRFPSISWTPQSSGTSIPLDVADELDQIIAHEQPRFTPIYEEGARRRVISSRIERRPQARTACLEHHGFDCAVCSFNFRNFYGELGDGLIHVHHLEPLSQARGPRQVDSIRDLRPVCANCHAVIHRRQIPLSIEELKDILVSRRKI